MQESASTSSKYKIWLIIIAILCLISGFFIGRCTRKTQTVTEYIEGKVIRDSIYLPGASSEETPENPEYITKYDTIYKDSLIYVAEKVDTATILQDWIKKRSYDVCLFDVDTVGKMNVHADVQYNKLQTLSYDYHPVYKVITQYKKPLFTPFIFGGINSYWRPELEIGTYIKNVGVSGSISHDKDKMFYSLKIGYKFN